MPESSLKTLEHYWGFSSFKKGQSRVIDQIEHRKDTLALLPTGGGKSICFQVPALSKPGICLVISPLVALMEEQVKDLKNRNIRATSLAGGLSQREIDRRFDNCFNGNFKFLYLSPERMKQEQIQQRLQNLPVNLIAVDEAHCISEWGHDFRPAYREIPALRELLPDIPLIALTATATKTTAADICDNLDIPSQNTVQQSFERPNLKLLIKKTAYKTRDLSRFLAKVNAPAIVYVRNRKSTLQISEFLNDEGISAGAYHGGLPQKERDTLRQNWRDEKFLVMIATTAFGMGIDKGNVGAVVHYQIPESLESYYQEAGRAGRNGKTARALLLYNSNDINVVRNQFTGNIPLPKTVKKIYKKLTSYLQIAYGEGFETRHNFSFADFCHSQNLNFYLTYQTLSMLDRSGVIQLSRQFHKRTALAFQISNRSLYNFLDQNKRYAKLVRVILRQNGGFFSFKTPIELASISKKADLPIFKIKTLLKELEKRDIIELSIANQDTSIQFLTAREDDHTINRLIPYIKQQYRSKKAKIDSVLQFITNNKQCKTQQILAYFGETKVDNCGKCSYCQGLKNKKPASENEIRQQVKQVRQALRDSKKSSRQLCETLHMEDEQLIPVLELMLDKNTIELTANNTYKLVL